MKNIKIRVFAPLGAYVAQQMLVNMLIAWMVPGSRLFELVRNGGVQARVGAVLVAALCVYVIADVVLLAAAGLTRGSVSRAAAMLHAFGRGADDARMYAYSLLAIAQVSQLHVAMRLGMSWLIGQVFLGAAVACVVCVFLDLHEQHQARLKARRAGDRL